MNNVSVLAKKTNCSPMMNCGVDTGTPINVKNR